MDNCNGNEALSPVATSNADLLPSEEVFDEIPAKLAKKMKICRQTNDFSRHNNRHSLQNCGEYFDLGLGRLKVSSHKNHQVSEDLITWIHSGTPSQTSYQSSFTTDHLPSQDTPTQRRFPKLHPSSSNPTGLLTSMTTWFGKRDQESRTPTQLLASSQEPHLPHNPWKYSYRAIDINAHLPAIKRNKKTC